MEYYKVEPTKSDNELMNNLLHRIRLDATAHDGSGELVYFVQPAKTRIKDEILDWCREQYGKFGYDWGIQYCDGIVIMFFEAEADVIAFKLKWK